MSFSLGLLQIVACAATAAGTTYWIVDSRERRLHLSTKGEEAYALVERVDCALAGALAACFGAGADAALDLGRVGERLWDDVARTRMLIAFYFPTLQMLMKRADSALAATAEACRAYEREPREENGLILENLVFDARDALQALRNAVVLTHRDQRGHLFGLRRRIEAAAPHKLRVAAP